jgi:hypothetical protein
MKKKIRSLVCVGNWARMNVSGFMEAANNPIQAMEVIAPKPADHISPFFKPETISDRAKPMEDNPFPQVTTFKQACSTQNKHRVCSHHPRTQFYGKDCCKT